jgi:hypothetical protein
MTGSETDPTRVASYEAGREIARIAKDALRAQGWKDGAEVAELEQRRQSAEQRLQERRDLSELIEAVRANASERDTAWLKTVRWLERRAVEAEQRLQELEEISELARELMPENPRPGSKTERLCQLLSTPEGIPPEVVTPEAEPE